MLSRLELSFSLSMNWAKEDHKLVLLDDYFIKLNLYCQRFSSYSTKLANMVNLYLTTQTFRDLVQVENGCKVTILVKEEHSI